MTMAKQSYIYQIRISVYKKTNDQKTLYNNRWIFSTIVKLIQEV